MNKYISTGFQIALAIAVVVLYFLHFSSPKSSSVDQVSGIDSTGTETTFIPESGINQKGIVFINTDSLLKHYDFYDQAKKTLEARQKKTENSLEATYKAIQQEAMQFQKKAQEGQMTQEEGARKEQELMAKQQQFMQTKETQMGVLIAEEQKLSEQLNKKIQEFVKKYSKGKEIQYVLGYTGLSSNILYKNDSLDITQPVLKGLNEEFRAKK